MRGTTARRTIAATALTALAAVTLGASAASAGVTGEDNVQIARIYFNDDYAIFTGVMFEQGCVGDFPVFPARGVDAPGGVHNFTARVTNDAALYDLQALGLSSPFELIELACSALAIGGEAPEPIATGRTQEVLQGHETADGGFQYRDSARGTLVDEDGTRYEVRGGSLERGNVDDAQLDGVEYHLVVKIR
jgi:hypothetical protein